MPSLNHPPEYCVVNGFVFIVMCLTFALNRAYIELIDYMSFKVGIFTVGIPLIIIFSMLLLSPSCFSSKVLQYVDEVKKENAKTKQKISIVLTIALFFFLIYIGFIDWHNDLLRWALGIERPSVLSHEFEYYNYSR